MDNFVHCFDFQGSVRIKLCGHKEAISRRLLFTSVEQTAFANFIFSFLGFQVIEGSEGFLGLEWSLIESFYFRQESRN